MDGCKIKVDVDVDMDMEDSNKESGMSRVIVIVNETVSVAGDTEPEVLVAINPVLTKVLPPQPYTLKRLSLGFFGPSYLLQPTTERSHAPSCLIHMHNAS